MNPASLAVFLFLGAVLRTADALTTQLFLNSTALSQSYQTANSTVLNLTENAVCKTKGGQEWRCKSLEECRHVRGDPAEVCSFQGVQPVVCCRPHRKIRSVRPYAKASAYCQKYLEMCEPNYSNPLVWPSFDSASERPPYQPTIAGGRLAKPKSHPHMALIGYGEEKEWLCGGSLISERFVLTAAHCSIDNTYGAPRWVRLGELDYGVTDDDARPQDLYITGIIDHPEYRKDSVYHDIALYLLEKEVEFTAYVRPACLHTAPSVPFRRGTATGWGRTAFSEDLSSGLREVELSLIDSEKCKALFENSVSSKMPEGVTPDSMICAGELEGGKDTCSGDSGGPLVMQSSNKCLKTQIGVTSFGRQCALPGSPGIYTRVAHYVPWIESVVWPD